MADDIFVSELGKHVERLRQAYPQADPPTVVQAVLHARNGLEATGLATDHEAVQLLAKIAERELRLRLHLDDDDARLDPETHRRPSP